MGQSLECYYVINTNGTNIPVRNYTHTHTHIHIDIYVVKLPWRRKWQPTWRIPWTEDLGRL